MMKNPVAAYLPTQPLRKDAAENRQRLLDAAGELLRTAPGEATVPAIAKQAGISPATAYRFFPSLESLLTSYLHGVVIQLREFSLKQELTGPELFDCVAAEWLRLVEIYGPAMVQLRSREGLLERLRAGESVISTVSEAWRRPITALLADQGLPEEQFEDALFIYNLLFDPREVLDLRGAGLAIETVRFKLTATLRAALHGWAGAEGPMRRQ